MAFGSTLAREQAYPDALWHERAANGAAGDKVVTFVADDDNRLLGMAAGLAPDAESPPDPIMVGVFVDGTVRRQGIGAALVQKVTGQGRVGRLGSRYGSQQAMSQPWRFMVATGLGRLA